MSHVTTGLDPWQQFPPWIVASLQYSTSLPCLQHELPSFQASTLGGIVPVDMCTYSWVDWVWLHPPFCCNRMPLALMSIILNLRVGTLGNQVLCSNSVTMASVSEQLLCGCVSDDDDGVVRISPCPQLTTGINYLQLNAGSALDTSIPEIQRAVLTAIGAEQLIELVE